MHDYNLKRKRVRPQETILDSDKYMSRYEPRQYENSDEEDPNRIVVDYVRKPMAENGIWSLVTAITGTAFFLIFVYQILGSGGNPGLNVTAIGACGILWSVAAVYFSVKGIIEKDRNHLTCFVGIALGAFQIITWVITLILTSR